MASRDEIVSVLLNIVFNKNSGDQANKALDKTRSYIDDVTKSAKKLAIVAPDVGESIAKNTDAAAGSVLRLRDAYEAVRKSATSAGKASGGGGSLNAIGNIGQVGSRALGAVGLGEIGQLVNSIGDLADAGKIADEVQNLVKSIAPLQGIAERLTPAIGASGAAFASLGLVIAPIAAAVLAVVVVLKALQDSAERAAKAQQEQIDASNKQFDQAFQIKQAAQNKTKEQLAQDYDNARAELDLNQQKLDAARARKAAIDEEFANLGSSFNPQRRSDLGAQGATEQKNIDDLTKHMLELQDQLVVTTSATQDSAQAQREAGDVALKAAQDHLAAMQDNQRMQAQLDELAATGTSKQAKAMVEANERQLASLQAYQKAAIEYAQSLKQGSEENRLASEQSAAYGHQIDLLTQQNEALTASTIPVIEAREKEAAAAEYQKKQFEETAEAVKKFNSDVANLDKGIQDSKDKLVETLDSIFAEAQKSAEQALEKLLQKRADLAQNAQRAEDKAARDAERARVNIQIDSQRAEIDAYKGYRRKLRDIQKQSDEDSFELILNRDFGGLFNLNRSTEAAKNQAAQDEIDSLEDIQEARKRSLDDLAQNIEAERQERQIALQQQIADAVAAYQLERVQIDAQRAEAFAKAKAAAAREQQLLQQQLDARAQSIRSELQLIQQGEQTRLQITNAAMQALINQAQQLLGALSGSGGGGGGGAGRGRAFGGSVTPFKSYNVNELAGQQESVTSGGQSFMLPKGAGVFTPFKSGTVNSNGGGGSGNTVNLTQNFSIQSGMDAGAIANLIQKKTVETIRIINGL